MKFNFDLHVCVDKPFNLDVTIHGDSEEAFKVVSSELSKLSAV